MPSLLHKVRWSDNNFVPDGFELMRQTVLANSSEFLVSFLYLIFMLCFTGSGYFFLCNLLSSDYIFFHASYTNEPAESESVHFVDFRSFFIPLLKFSFEFSFISLYYFS